MTQFTKTLYGYARPLAALLLAAILFTACKKDDSNFPQQPSTAAGLMAFNLAPDQAAVGFTLSNNPLRNTALNYTEFTGVYLPVYIGNREVRSVDYYTGATIALTNASFADSMYYSVFVVGYNGNYKNVLVQDNLDALTATPGKAWVRYINAIADSAARPTVNIDEGAVNETAAYASVSAFAAVDAGVVNVTVQDGTRFNATRSLTLEADKIYTILLTGVPGSTEPGKAVQIKFITNGAITP
jgi:hypothetical protein